MPARPDLSRKIDSKTFRSFYYLKEELVAFCRENGFSTSGSKIELHIFWIPVRLRRLREKLFNVKTLMSGILR